MKRTLALICVIVAGQSSFGLGDAVLVPMPRTCAYSPGRYDLPSGTLVPSLVSFSEDAAIRHEGYRISITTNGIAVVSSDAAGAFYALKTLEQLGDPENGKLVFPLAEIEDWPSYRYRGMHFDDCRHFFGKQTLKRTLDLMADHKYNVLSWHLTEDQGWRFDVPNYPDLVKYGAVRPESPVHGAKSRDVAGVRVMAMDGQPYGPFYYTDADLREIVAYAAERHIEVIPEIDVPGHIAAALAAYPEFACRPENLAHRHPRCVWGIEKDVLCLGNERALKFVEDVLAYVAKTFPSAYINILGDECPTDRWAACPKCRALMKREGLKDVKELQPWFTRRMVRFVEGLGKRAIAADECLEGEGIPKTLVGLYWRGADAGVDGVEGVRRGHDMIMIPHDETYFYYSQGLSSEVDPFQYGTGAVLTLEKTYRFDPARGIPHELRGHVLGGMGCNWSEFTWNEYDLAWKMWPRGCAMAEVLWLGDAKPGYPSFLRRMKTHRGRLVAKGVNCAPLPN